ncbi:DMT family transporter [Actinomadura flavalba]|uniref:DMT family transporter n=1 Tax=Actinomadura flavalba TaxID=1120938 RepID=UPI00037BA470|nr:multidrug efflux SMR transporter [Actinomadura flavalba]
MAWIYLLIAAVFEVVFALATNASDGFTQLWPSLLTAGAAGLGIFFLSLALKTLDVGVGYTVWVGIGSVGTVVFGTLIFDEPMTLAKAASFVLIIGGVLGLKLSDRAAEPVPDERPLPEPVSA